MDVRINQLTSTVHTTDGAALISPEVLRQLRQIIRAQVLEELERQQQQRQERGVQHSFLSHDDEDR